MKPINGWTKEKMITHIKAEFKGKSIGAMDYCMYRGPEGKKCAIGMFIPDSKYVPKMEYDSVGVLFNYLAPFMPLDVDGMGSLQGVHDLSKPENTLSDMLAWIERNVESDGDKSISIFYTYCSILVCAVILEFSYIAIYVGNAQDK